MKKRSKARVDRPNYIGFYATDEEREIIVEGAAALGMSVSAYLRYLAIEENRERRTVQIAPRKRVVEYAQ